jgi:hypothetical protein
MRWSTAALGAPAVLRLLRFRLPKPHRLSASRFATGCDPPRAAATPALGFALPRSRRIAAASDPRRQRSWASVTQAAEIAEIAGLPLFRRTRLRRAAPATRKARAPRPGRVLQLLVGQNPDQDHRPHEREVQRARTRFWSTCSRIVPGTSHHKRRLASALTARGAAAQQRELVPRALTHNLALIAGAG